MAGLLACDEETFVQRAYWAALGRDPDPAGYANYLDRLRSGAPRTELIAELSDSPEGRARGGAGLAAAMAAADPAAARPSAVQWSVSWSQLAAINGRPFIHCAYRALLGRQPDETGLRNYVALMRRGVPKIQMLAAMRYSPEFRRRRRALIAAGAGQSPAGRRLLTLFRRIDREIVKFYIGRAPLLGWLLRPLLGVEGMGALETRLRRIEYLLAHPGEAQDEPPEAVTAPGAGRERASASAEDERRPGGLREEASRPPQLPAAAALRSLAVPANWRSREDHA